MKQLLTLIILGSLLFAQTAIADDNPCRFILAQNGSMINPRQISVIQSYTVEKMETGSNRGRFKVVLVTVDGSQVLYRSYDYDHPRDLAIERLTNRVEICLQQ